MIDKKHLIAERQENPLLKSWPYDSVGELFSVKIFITKTLARLLFELYLKSFFLPDTKPKFIFYHLIDTFFFTRQIISNFKSLHSVFWI